jgi:hypothetical protein
MSISVILTSKRPSKDVPFFVCPDALAAEYNANVDFEKEEITYPDDLTEIKAITWNSVEAAENYKVMSCVHFINIELNAHNSEHGITTTEETKEL